jgi:hypothetical protein
VTQSLSNSSSLLGFRLVFSPKFHRSTRTRAVVRLYSLARLEKQVWVLSCSSGMVEGDLKIYLDDCSRWKGNGWRGDPRSAVEMVAAGSVLSLQTSPVSWEEVLGVGWRRTGGDLQVVCASLKGRQG